MEVDRAWPRKHKAQDFLESFPQVPFEHSILISEDVHFVATKVPAGLAPTLPVQLVQLGSHTESLTWERGSEHGFKETGVQTPFPPSAPFGASKLEGKK